MKKYSIEFVDVFIRVFALPMYYLAGISVSRIYISPRAPVIEALLSQILTLLTLIFALISLIALFARAVVSRRGSEVFYALSSMLFFVSGYIMSIYPYQHFIIYFIALALTICSTLFRHRKKLQERYSSASQ